MSLLGYAFGLLLLAIVVLSLCSTAVSLRRALLPGWAGAEARLAELVLASSAAVVLLEALGLVSLLRRPAIVLGSVLLAALATRFPRRPSADRVPREEGEPVGLGAGLAAGAAVMLVLAQWLTSIHRNARDGIHGFDALHYHLTFSAHFAQDHSVLPTHRLDALGLTTWYPLNNELVQGAGMVLLRSTVLTLAIDLVALAAVLLCAWVIGAQHGVGPAAVVAVCIPLAVLGPIYAGTANNDWPSVWPLLAALALIAVSRNAGQLSLVVVALAGLAGGLAIGTKLTVVLPAVVLVVVAVALSPGQRWRALGVSAGAHLLTGGYWYVRNLLIVGNPTPSTKVGIGPVQLPKPATPLLDQQGFDVVHYATNGSVLRHWFVPGLHWFLGPAWPAVLAVVAVGFGLALTRGRRTALVLPMAVCGLSSIALYLITPTSAGGPEGKPILFMFNIRYAILGITIGALLVVLCTAGTRVELPALIGLLSLLAVTLVRPGAWAVGWPGEPLLLVVGLGAAVLLLRLGRHVVVPMAAATAVLGGSAAAVAARHYDESAYQVRSAADTLFANVRADRDQRVGLLGQPLQFPYFGKGLTNEVTYLGRTGAEHSFGDLTTCGGLLTAVQREHVTRVVIQPYDGRPTPDWEGWLRADPHVHELVKTRAGVVFRVEPGAGPGSCR